MKQDGTINNKVIQHKKIKPENC